MADLFVINLEYKVDLSIIDQFMHEHMEFLKVCYDKKIFLVSGRKQPRTGGMILAKGLTLKQVTELMEKDPFVSNNLADVQITAFSASQFQPEFKKLFETLS